MKKFVSIALAIVMVLSVSVCAFAEDYVDSVASEVLSEFEILFPMTGWWNEDDDLSNSTDKGVEFVEAIQTEGAYIVVKCDAAVASGEDGDGYQFGIQTTDTYANVLIHFNYAGGEGNMGAEYVAIDGDYAYIFFAAADFIDACTATDVDIINTNTWRWVYGSGNDTKTYGIYVILPASSESSEETTEEVSSEASEAEETTEEASESTETTTASSPDTGVALALVPMAIAGIAVVSSKRR